ncbi:hypothetical protein [Actinomyces sp.]|uniref:hypothetical protein n=1 Tax=Actinomyces sp. TaxID=29317 RepID=UPI0026DC41E3|nr:hypothetical protein [Actinomyces sp.]MDO4899875.1 hypothetical protein [Actinomyces sp.]
MSVFVDASSTRGQLIFFAITRVMAVVIALVACYSQLIAIDYPLQWLSRPLGVALSVLAVSYLVTIVPTLSEPARRRWCLAWSVVLLALTAWTLGAVFAAAVTTAVPGAHVLLADCPELTGALIVMLLGALWFGFRASGRPVSSKSSPET